MCEWIVRSSLWTLNTLVAWCAGRVEGSHLEAWLSGGAVHIACDTDLSTLLLGIWRVVRGVGAQSPAVLVLYWRAGGLARLNRRLLDWASALDVCMILVRRRRLRVICLHLGAVGVARYFPVPKEMWWHNECYRGCLEEM